MEQAGLPADREELASMWETWDDFIEVGKQFTQNAPEGQRSWTALRASTT